MTTLSGGTAQMYTFFHLLFSFLLSLPLSVLFLVTHLPAFHYFSLDAFAWRQSLHVGKMHKCLVDFWYDIHTDRTSFITFPARPFPYLRFSLLFNSKVTSFHISSEFSPENPLFCSINLKALVKFGVPHFKCVIKTFCWKSVFRIWFMCFVICFLWPTHLSLLAWPPSSSSPALFARSWMIHTLVKSFSHLILKTIMHHHFT